MEYEGQCQEQGKDILRVLGEIATPGVLCTIQFLCASSYLFVVYEHGGLKTVGCPLYEVCRLLWSHVNQHTFSYHECWQP